MALQDAVTAAPVTLGGGHCCACLGLCHHVGPVQLCAEHEARPEPGFVFSTERLEALGYRHDPNCPRRFCLQRDEDESGVSGTGTVAYGLQFADGTCVMRWNTVTASTAVYGALDDVVHIHGHGGKTRVRWIDV